MNQSKQPIKEEKNEFPGIYGAFLKFVGGGLFGSLLSLLLMAIIAEIMKIAPDFEMGNWTRVYWIIPLRFAFLGIFWFEEMLHFAEKIINSAFGVED